MVVLPVILGTWLGARRGRILSGLVWSLLLSWLGVVIVLCLRDLSKVQCPRCAERSRSEAVVCRFCGASLVSPDALLETPVSLREPDPIFPVRFPDGREVRWTSTAVRRAQAMGHMPAEAVYWDPDFAEWRPIQEIPDDTISG